MSDNINPRSEGRLSSLNKDQINSLKDKLQKIKDLSYSSIEKSGPNTDWVIVNNLAHECQKIVEYKIKTL